MAQVLRRRTLTWLKHTLGPLLLALCGTSWAFNCGPHALTYAVNDDTGAPVGIRCVRYSFLGVDQALINCEFTWYGEGRWGDRSYRHIGQAMQNNAIVSPGVGFAADISGNGEFFSGGACGTLRPDGGAQSTMPAAFIKGNVMQQLLVPGRGNKS